MKSLKLFLAGLLIPMPVWFAFNFTEAKLEDFFVSQFYLSSQASSVWAETEIESATPSNLPIAPVIDAKSALVLMIDSSGRQSIIFEQDSEQSQPIASLTKLMTAVIVFENQSLSREIIISPESVAQEGDSGNLKAGEKISISELLKMVLVESSNDAAEALAESYGKGDFIALMNLKANGLGMGLTHFSNATGLEAENNFSNAKDLATLSESILKNYSVIFKISSRPSVAIMNKDGQLHHLALNTNDLLSLGQPGNLEIVGGKTGYTQEAGGCIILVLKDQEDNYFINVVLGANSPEARFLEMERLISWIQSFNSQ
ncbi:MAG: serine hydrolase [bacterium]|nr:serine hydrolase [bacterium]